MTLYKWSQTASADATADSTINWAEGQSPSSVNDSARAMMAAIAKYRDDTGGQLGGGGTTSAFTLATNQGFDTLAHLDSKTLSFVAPSTNVAGATLNVDGLGAKPICTDASGTPIPAGVLVAGTVYQVTYYNSTGQFRLWGLYSNPYNIPLGGAMVYFGATVPNSNFAFPNGQAISRTTYSTLFTLLGSGTIYGNGDGSSTFNLPDLTGRVPAMRESVATRLTATGGGVDGATLGASNGGNNQNITLAQANLPNITLTTNITDPGHTHFLNAIAVSFNGSGTPSVRYNSGIDNFGSMTTSTTGITASTPLGGSGAAFKVVQPTLITNYIMRII